MCRVCALFCPRIASPLLNRYYPHVLSISCNCLAPPHFPESCIECFIPQCMYCSHVASVFARSLLSVCLPFSCIPRFNICSCSESSDSCFLFPVFRSNLFSVLQFMSRKSCMFFMISPPSVCISLCLVCLVLLLCLLSG